MTKRPSLFWVEPQELALLIGRVSAPLPGGLAGAAVRDPAGEALRNGGEEGSFSATSTVETAAPNPLVSRPPEHRSRESRPTAFEPSDAPLEQRLHHLLSWVRSMTAFDHAFVVSEEGLAVVHQESAPLELIAASAQLCSTWDSLKNRFDLASENVLSVHLTGEQHLALLTAESGWGRMSLGLVVTTPVSRNRLSAIGEQFHRTLLEKEQEPS